MLSPPRAKCFRDTSLGDVLDDATPLVSALDVQFVVVEAGICALALSGGMLILPGFHGVKALVAFGHIHEPCALPSFRARRPCSPLSSASPSPSSSAQSRAFSPLVLRSTRLTRLLPSLLSIQYPTILSWNRTFCAARSHCTLSAPLASCTCPQIASRGRTRHSACRNASQPFDPPELSPLAGASSTWYFGGVCVTTISVDRGIDDQRSAACTSGAEGLSE